MYTNRWFLFTFLTDELWEACPLHGSSCYYHKPIKRQHVEMLVVVDLWPLRTLIQEMNISTIKDGAWKFPTVQTRKKFRFERLQKVPVCVAQFSSASLVTSVCTAPKKCLWFWQMANLASLILSSSYIEPHEFPVSKVSACLQKLHAWPTPGRVLVIFLHGSRVQNWTHIK
jgi:hypothetical protein